MPVTEVNSANITFAFSEKQDAWTTRYSFVPTCYANCDDQMLSFKEALGKVWLHDKSSTRNRFYDGLNPSFLEVSFNDSPSEVKVFNSVSGVANSAKMHLLGWLIAILITLNRLGKLCWRQACAIFSTIIGSTVSGATRLFRNSIA